MSPLALSLLDLVLFYIYICCILTTPQAADVHLLLLALVCMYSLSAGIAGVGVSSSIARIVFWSLEGFVLGEIFIFICHK